VVLRLSFNSYLFIAYSVLWTLLAIEPKYRDDWFLENILVFLTVPLLFWLDRKFNFSKGGATALFIFYSLHAFGSHYTYSETPLFLYISDFFELQRNHFDRVAHFLYGLLISIPLADLIQRVSASRVIKATLVISLIYGSAGLYEVLEWLVTEVTHPDLGTAFLGVQGDQWDSQKDIALAQLGVLISSKLWLSRLTSS
jgi:putative membrane protein